MVVGVLAVLAGYVTGSVPFAFLLARRKGVDLRLAGSGNVGASNVLRTSGVLAGVLAVCLDGLKGCLAVLIASSMTTGGLAPVAAGVASILGHVYPPWLAFRGGKGVAPAAGVFVILAPMALGVAAAVFVAVVWLTRYVSAGSLAAALTLAVSTLVGNAPIPVVGGAFATLLIVVHRHRGNVARLLSGSERRVGQRVV